jgi:hypothetical protein
MTFQEGIAGHGGLSEQRGRTRQHKHGHTIHANFPIVPLEINKLIEYRCRRFLMRMP